MSCGRSRAESGGNYAAVSPNGMYMGAFQFSQATWNSAARAAGRPDLVGVPPDRASKADQDTVAVALYALDGQQPWLGDRCSS
ncbi:MAG TPA: transglycosylase family protein [Acidimicrobiales bacterium]|nr:transglycosylase family protein [Acidimicrobiales bacterium]HVA02192.1 transglycosylase family protein [Acidimicrobiales bacterium]